jgi:hypothetical protein
MGGQKRVGLCAQLREENEESDDADKRGETRVDGEALKGTFFSTA